MTGEKADSTYKILAERYDTFAYRHYLNVFAVTTAQ